MKVKKMGGRSSGTSTPSSEKGSSALDPLSMAMDGSDPLSMMAAEATDPLSQMAAQMSIADTMAPVSSVTIDTHICERQGSSRSYYSHYFHANKLFFDLQVFFSIHLEVSKVKFQKLFDIRMR